VAEQKSPHVPLSRERILDAAQALVLAEGVGALSMRRVAAELGTGAMSLYNHVRDKEALQAGLAERVLAQVDVPVGASRRELCASWTRSVRRVLLTNAPMLPLVLSASRRNTLSELGRILGRALDAAGMAERDARDVTSVLGRYVAGTLMFDGAVRRGDSATIITVDELDRTFEIGLEALLTGLDGVITAAPAMDGAGAGAGAAEA
jgi:AcrR family transcriptional regulator